MAGRWCRLTKKKRTDDGNEWRRRRELEVRNRGCRRRVNRVAKPIVDRRWWRRPAGGRRRLMRPRAKAQSRVGQLGTRVQGAAPPPCETASAEQSRVGGPEQCRRCGGRVVTVETVRVDEQLSTEQWALKRRQRWESRELWVLWLVKL